MSVNHLKVLYISIIDAFRSEIRVYVGLNPGREPTNTDANQHIIRVNQSMGHGGLRTTGHRSGRWN